MVKCSFCKFTIEPGTGSMFVQNDGKVLHFCRPKCRKSMLVLKRAPRYLKWTKVFEKGAGK